MLSETKISPSAYSLLKRTQDVVIALAGMTLLSPLILYAALRVRLSSPGAVFYSQERVGINGRKFRMLKFRSMYTDAEAQGPQLSTDNDTRITPWGRTMRKFKLDELPQLWNVLKGDMSIVGPRPEREYFIRQLERQRPAHAVLLRVKPGVTSMGVVRFGYAGSVDEMAQRMKYDLLYVQKRSLLLDAKIILCTLQVIFRASGR